MAGLEEQLRPGGRVEVIGNGEPANQQGVLAHVIKCTALSPTARVLLDSGPDNPAPLNAPASCLRCGPLGPP